MARQSLSTEGIYSAAAFQNIIAGNGTIQPNLYEERSATNSPKYPLHNADELGIVQREWLFTRGTVNPRMQARLMNTNHAAVFSACNGMHGTEDVVYVGLAMGNVAGVDKTMVRRDLAMVSFVMSGICTGTNTGDEFINRGDVVVFEYPKTIGTGRNIQPAYSRTGTPPGKFVFATVPLRRFEVPVHVQLILTDLAAFWDNVQSALRMVRAAPAARAGGAAAAAAADGGADGGADAGFVLERAGDGDVDPNAGTASLLLERLPPRLLWRGGADADPLQRALRRVVDTESDTPIAQFFAPAAGLQAGDEARDKTIQGQAHAAVVAGVKCFNQFYGFIRQAIREEEAAASDLSLPAYVQVVKRHVREERAAGTASASILGAVLELSYARLLRRRVIGVAQSAAAPGQQLDLLTGTKIV